MTKAFKSQTDISPRDSINIEAHLTVCFVALAICRYIQDRTKISIKKFVRKLEVLRTAVIEIAGQKHIAKPAIDVETQELVKM